MKKLNLLFAFVTLLFVSCSSDDGNDNPAVITGELAGSWSMVEYNYEGETSYEYMGQSVSSDVVGEAYDIDYVWTFTETPNEVIADGAFGLEVTATSQGESETQDFGMISQYLEGTWEMEGDVITMTSDELIQEFVILEMTETMMKLKSDISDTQNQQGYEVTQTMTTFQTFVREE
ncbi:lipocalin family protein [Mangrovimonas sp. YM274]|uniref:lipocalin family protein n=1 Tax=Mangrovimonas sp. YM274 TaxID=3070660 RepID=UPI0027DE60E0|nr:lipocalin family protein [Mangrovimonas sp. YM274]WMI67534.1 lipocalin family protein [Mangrovimonas sp. YM274]